jgi:hypothetical protein
VIQVIERQVLTVNESSFDMSSVLDGDNLGAIKLEGWITNPDAADAGLYQLRLNGASTSAAVQRTKHTGAVHQGARTDPLPVRHSIVDDATAAPNVHDVYFWALIMFPQSGIQRTVFVESSHGNNNTDAVEQHWYVADLITPASGANIVGVGMEDALANETMGIGSILELSVEYV